MRPWSRPTRGRSAPAQWAPLILNPSAAGYWRGIRVRAGAVAQSLPSLILAAAAVFAGAPAVALTTFATRPESKLAPPPASGMDIGACDAWYPEALRTAGKDGAALLAVHLMPDGSVTSATLIESSGNSDLDKAAIDCLKAIHLDPATSHGEPEELDWERAVVWRAHDHSSVTLPRLPGRKLSCVSPRFRTYGLVTTAVSFQIGPDGYPEDASVLQSSGTPGLDQFAIQCIVPSWRFPVATVGGKPVEVDWRSKLNWRFN